MGKKGIETKEMIRREAYPLFASGGFKDITMKDICEATGLSRGGLYRHYDSTRQIFREILDSLIDEQDQEFGRQLEKNQPAADILNAVLKKYKDEMLDAKNSLSLAIYEYYSTEESTADNLLNRQYYLSYSSWERLMEYGIVRGEFRKADIRTIFDLLIFSYQGVRMYSRLTVIEEAITERIINQIRELILPEQKEDAARQIKN